VEVLPTHPSPATPHLIQVGRAEIFGRGEIPKWEEIECTPEAYRSLFPGSIAPRDAKWKRIHEEDFQTPPDFAHLWEIRNVPFGPSRPAVTWEQGHIKLSDRGYLVFRKPFESSSTLGLRVAGRWTIVSPKDQPEVVLHTDAIPHPPYGDVAEGVSVGMLLEEGHGTITILPRTADLSLEGGISVARIPARIGDSFYFEATSLGQEIRFRVWNANENATTATLRGRVLGTYRHHQVAFHNRNRQRWPMVLHLNQVRFDQMAGTSEGNPDPPSP
jgi:hypothetical protein